MDFPEILLATALTAASGIMLGFGLGTSSVRDECKTYHELRIDGQKYSCNINRPDGQEKK